MKHYEKRDESELIVSGWEQALETNLGDYAYGPNGEMISRQKDGNYTVSPANLGSTGKENLPVSEINPTLKEMKIPSKGWTFE